ncbi:hypothetical protein VB638_05285 [Dolichospermum sp. UHCC 0684]|uniref:hypothetical protein n=1 Tax=unclassified Dolichospermum TaxID=2622029 RepID=UPI001446697A|nr:MULTISPECIES: hypothetical protein [unclassified Dolichospermum]MEA5529007.1 hypothetical protein [Dolichospermum sp. UHCC 0684]MTJ33993.1 hypothetical protein [Dolichospermum sp. UHCC 0260]
MKKRQVGTATGGSYKAESNPAYNLIKPLDIHVPLGYTVFMGGRGKVLDTTTLRPQRVNERPRKTSRLRHLPLHHV